MKKIVLLILAGFCVVTVAITLWAQTPSPGTCALRNVEEQVVLYTIYRGGYEQIGQAIGSLFALAGQKGLMPPQGPVVQVYLNNPNLVAKEHYLTEIRIPVSKKALEQVGKLGPMTDIKILPPMQVAVITKPEGMENPTPLYWELQTWCIKNQYCVMDDFCEITLTNAMSGNYARMKTEIIAPVMKMNNAK